mgnify:FL=1
MLSYRISFLILSCFFTFASSYAQYFKKIGMKDGLSSLSVVSIYQDPLGRMWFGTTEGLNIYNGNKISRITKYQSLVEGKVETKNLRGNVSQILGDGKERVFIINNNTLLEYNLLKDKFTEISSNGVRTMNFYEGKLYYFVKDSLMSYVPDCPISFQKRYDIPYITCMEYKSGIFYIGTKNGLFRVKDEKVECILPDIEIYKIFQSSSGEFWVASRMNGLYRIKADNKIIEETISPSRVVSPQIREFVEDNRKRIWFGTFDGLQMYDPEKDEYKVYRAENIAGTLEHNSVFSLYKDIQNTIWVGSYYGGVNYFNTEFDLFSYYRNNNSKDGRNLSFPIVGQVFEDREHNLWIATDGGGINVYNKQNGSFTYFDASMPNSILHNNVKSMAYDNERDCVYIGTYTGGLSKYDRKTKTFYNYLEHSTKEKSPSDRIHCCKYHDGILYITATNGFWTLDVKTNVFSIVDYHADIISMEIDQNDNIWLTSKENIYLYNIRTSEFIRLYGLENRLPKHIRITKVLPAKKGNNLYISTLGAGFFSYDMDSKTLKQYLHEENGLLSNFCYNIAETEKGDVFITNDKGFSIFMQDERLVKTVDFQADKGMISTVIDVCGIYVSPNDVVYMGGVGGMMSLDYKKYKTVLNSIGDDFFHLETLYINNSLISPSDNSGILSKTLAYTDEINLKHNQNNISFTFANSNYIGLAHTTAYYYMLEGFDKGWGTTESTNINYTNIPPGKYKLIIRKVGNKLGGAGKDEISLFINVSHPWYANIYAYIIYFVIIIAIFYSYWRISLTRQKLALSLENEKREKQRIEEVNKLKLRFFTNISHEFRTPLTLIMGQLETLIQNEGLSLSVQRKLQRIYKNSLNMRNLITELLDFRKQEQGYLQLKVEKYDLVSFVRDIFDSFKEYADKRGIEYNFYHTSQNIEAWFDGIQLQKVIFNLLSNAFKYTPVNGNISIKVASSHEMLEIEVKDNGCGIASESVDKIFNRFYQADNAPKEPLRGTGIGLALTKGIVELHKGRIEVNSEVDKGSTFRVLLPAGNSHFTTEELNLKEKRLLTDAVSNDISVELDDEVSTTVPENEISDDIPVKPVMLIVEDDDDILTMLEEIFMPVYKVFSARNGAEGFDMAQKLYPAIILSDVMMPIMTGKEMCYKIKNSLELSHIPVVLLTAQTSEEHTVEGYMFGADDYVTKPFNVKMLMSRCNSLVKNRRLIFENLRNIQIEDKGVSVVANVTDLQFVEQVTEIIKKNFDNPEFDMNVLASEVNMGRSKLYIRIKEATGITPNEFTLHIKLKEGLKMLKESPTLNISEIAYRLGFTSPRYFSKCFKDFYGVTPQAYRKKNENL